jgi:hypothetical protein
MLDLNQIASKTPCDIEGDHSPEEVPSHNSPLNTKTQTPTPNTLNPQLSTPSTRNPQPSLFNTEP